MGLLSLYRSGKLKVWPDVFNRMLDDKAAPDLGDVVGGGEPIYSDPDQFFARTYMTRSVENLIGEVADALESREGGSIFLLTSLYGGGKTHTMITLYHAFTKPEALKKVNERLAARTATIRPLVVVIDGSRRELAPTPKDPCSVGGFTIKTLWGMLAHRLGAYAKVMHLDGLDAPPPFTDVLMSVLKEPNRPVLIMVDEMLPHIYTVSRAEGLRGYAENLIMFMGYLARAVERTPGVALLVSLQMERRGDQIIEEETYAGLAKRLYDELHRETTRVITPVTPTDVVQILKRRIFQEIPEDEAGRARDALHSAYREYPEIFGSESDWQFSPEESGRVLSAKDTYPFHPKYIEVLQEFISRNRDLRRTRDAIRITRKVVRRILRENEDPTFIMPWHIDIRDMDIRNSVLTESRREFRDVASKDVADEDGRLGAITECSRPMLAFKTALPILLKVYTYETFKIPLRTFPTLRDAALMTYDPETFSSEGLQPPDIRSILDEMPARLSHFNYQDGRYWFDPYLPITDLVEKRAGEILGGPRLNLYRALAEQAKGLLVRRPRRGEREWAPFLFSEKRTHIVEYGASVYGIPEIEDRPEHRLIVFVKPRDSISDREVEDAILRSKGGLRTYRNTVAAVLPKAEADFEKMLSYAAKIRAAEDIGRELKELFRGDEEIAKIRQEKLKQYMQEIENRLNSELLFALTCIAYPRMEDGRDTVHYVVTAPLDAIIAQAETALEDSSTGPKMRRRISFDELTSFLSRLLRWDLAGGDRPIEFGKMLEVFYTNTAAPFTRRDVVEEAIREGLRRLDIGVKMADKVYWKKFGSEEPNIPAHLRDDAEILPLSIAAKEFSDMLLSKEKQITEGGRLRVIWYEVEFEGQRFKLRDLIGQPGWVEILKEGIVREVEETIERGFVINVEPSMVEVDEGNSIEVSVSITPVGGYGELVKLTPSKGTIEPASGSPPFTAKWRIDPLPAGRRMLKVTAEGADGYLREEDLSINVRSLEEEVTVRRLDQTHVGAKLIEVSVGDLTHARIALSRIAQLGAKAKADFYIKIGSNITVNGSGADIKVSELIVQKIADLARNLQAEAALSVRMDEPIEVYADRIAVLEVLADKATFKLRVRRSAAQSAG
ncbi:MAG: DUF499 domain-containing protein [Candidatus Bathyarchaeia archaeon]